jgi:hypothetical protein
MVGLLYTLMAIAPFVNRLPESAPTTSVERASFSPLLRLSCPPECRCSSLRRFP